MNDKSVIDLLLVGTCLIVIFAAALLAFAWIQKRKQNAFHQEREKLQMALIEERERTMNDISSDIQNNIAQIVSFSQMLLKTALLAPSLEEASGYINQAVKLLSGIGDELQIMGKSLNSGFLKQWGLLKVLDTELEYIKSAYPLNCWLDVQGTQKPMEAEQEVLVYRIIQDAIDNVLKHAQAGTFNILFHYRENDQLHITVTDDGIGLPNGQVPVTHGTGIRHMKERAKLLNGKLDISVAEKNGLTVSLLFNMNSQSGPKTNIIS